MPEYEVPVTKIVDGIVVVEADSPEDAYELARGMVWDYPFIFIEEEVEWNVEYETIERRDP